jgi:ABC-2 type transport system ATP-binding protein
MIEVHQVSKQFANHTALDGVSMVVPQGSIFGLLGPNGAGKTTLIRIINRITTPDSGWIHFEGRPMTSEDIQRIGYLPEERGLYKKMKVGEQALYFAQLRGMSHAEALSRLKAWFIKFGIQNWWDKKVEELSKGMAQKVQFIIAVLHEPEVLILDEPFSGFDPVNTQLIKSEIFALKEKGSTILLSTHNMASVEEMCDQIALINKSKCVLTGAVDELRRSYGARMYQFDIRGNAYALASELADFGIIEEAQQLEGGKARLVLRLHPQVSVPALLAKAYEAPVEIAGFYEKMPSMNDIFMREVGADASVKGGLYGE